MGYPVKQASTTQPLLFLMVDSTDHVTGKTGLTPTVTISKAGAAFASPAGAVTEIANGWYKVAGNATDNATLGPLLLHATGTAADPTDDCFPVVAYDPTTQPDLSATRAEPAQGTPAATLSPLSKLDFLYKAWRNKTTQTASQYSLFNDDAATVDHKATFADDATTATRGEVATGP